MTSQPWVDEVDQGAPLGSPSAGTAERGGSHDAHETPDFEIRDIPLQYRSLFAESGPRNGQIPIARLGALLEQADVTGEAAVLILDTAGARSGTVDEDMFYRALALASTYQNSKDLEDLSQSGKDVPYREIELIHDTNASYSGPAGPSTYNPAEKDQLRVTARDDLEGNFVFRHVVYDIEGTNDEQQIRTVRRYSDFTWLLQQLVKKFTFRTLPLLPPKKLAVNGRYLSSNSAFIDQRARGLSRFVNLLLSHPVVSKDQLVQDFFSSKSQMDTLKTRYQKVANEIVGKSASPLFIAQWDAATFETLYRSVKQATDAVLVEVTNLIQIHERQISRYNTASTDAAALAASSASIVSFLPKLYPDLEDSRATIGAGLQSARDFGEANAEELASAAKELRSGPLEALRKYRDLLRASAELFFRHNTHGRNEIAKLERRIESLRSRIISAAAKPEISETAIRKLHEQVKQHQGDIRHQTNRDWLIKETLTNELHMSQSSLFQLSKALRELSLFLLTNSEKNLDETTKFCDAVGLLPVKI